MADNPDDVDDTFGSISMLDWGEDHFLCKLLVPKKHRGKGHGRRLVKEAISRAEGRVYLAPKAFADLDMSDEGLILWYQSLGFEVVDAKEHGYLGKNVLMMHPNGYEA